jgi:DNA-binding PucR family transcriptional regulator
VDAGSPPETGEATCTPPIRQHASSTVLQSEAVDVNSVLRRFAGDRGVAQFITSWLCDLLAYDDEHGTEFVHTLTTLLERGCNQRATARALAVHRNTLVYRVRRITEISGHDVNDVETRLNLHLATRALMLQGNG